MSDWQDISTAPRDGTRVLVWSDRRAWHEVGIAYWGRNSPLDPQSWLGGHCHTSHIDQPTHWRPLPLPPKAES